MLRYRRYRVFVAFAVISLFALYHLGSSGTSRRDGSRETAPSKGPKEQAASALKWRPRPQVAQETKKLDLEIPVAKASQALQHPPPIAPVNRPLDTPPPVHTTPAASLKKDTGNPWYTGEVDEAVSVTAHFQPNHWKPQSEHFPIPASKIIKLPSSKPKPIPKIQHTFKPESIAAKADRESKLDVIKGVFKRSWDGYREYAWMQDELSPVSGKFRNPFASWGATLVDSLDTLWIMGMKTEFEEAVKAVDKIDFTTSPRSDIPLFETTIRYLGGLVAAYDISDRKYENLLRKAVELAEVLISAFDTPNRMPIMYYHWDPAFASRPKRASSRAVLAEIGSLSVEFTRLAQLTGEHRYYDAIARITDNLEGFQNKTRLPGMWPTYLDTSGCTIVDPTPQYESPPPVPAKAPVNEAPLKAKNPPTPSKEEHLSPNGKKYKPLDLPAPMVFVAGSATAKPSATTLVPEAPVLRKRQLEDYGLLDDEGSITSTVTLPATSPSPSPSMPKCEDIGFLSSTSGGSEEYTLGGMSDSTYEYLPKQWLLLGGEVEKYRTMYEKSMDVVIDNLIFRPMLPNETDILFSGKLFVPPTIAEGGKGDKPELEGENAHLTCFAGGMFGMGAKIFDRPEDLEIAKKLTEGCVWSYDMTATGIMPESFITVPCESTKPCEWNQTKYWEAIDPNAKTRLKSYKNQVETYKKQMISASAWYAAELASMTAAAMKTASGPFEAVATPSSTLTSEDAQYDSSLESQQLGIKTEHDSEDPELDTFFQSQKPDKRDLSISAETKAQLRKLKIETKTEPDPRTVPDWKAPERKPLGESRFLDEIELPPTPAQAEPSVEPNPTIPVFPFVYSPKPPLTHEEYVEQRIQEDRLPPGVTSVRARNYILRPEAIESVWYMYRITGDPHWREAGWRMFEAVDKHTATVYGNSAIDDVTKTVPTLNDEMESFWLAETLKYFYLLFADEDVISLDEWVLNTEAHPFRRPT